MDINITKTVNYKITYEREDQIWGVEIKGYHTENGFFNASEFMEDMFNRQQNIRFVGISPCTKMRQKRATSRLWLLCKASF